MRKIKPQQSKAPTSSQQPKQQPLPVGTKIVNMGAAQFLLDPDFPDLEAKAAQGTTTPPPGSTPASTPADPQD
jgi:hypothetical protein